jgi:copper homeostasis protein (lipoprotein)
MWAACDKCVFLPLMKLKNFIAIVLMLVLAWACKPNQKQEKQFKGQVIWHQDFTTFTDCNTGKEYWLEDKTGEVAAKYKQIATQPYQQVYFVFEADLLPSATTGAAAVYDNIISVKKLVSASATPQEGQCSLKNNNAVFACTGETPGHWQISFDTLNIIFESNYPNDTLVFFPLADAVVRDTAAMGKVFYYNVGNENFQNIELIVTEKGCENKGVVSHFSSKVLFGGISYEGCAKMKTITK